MPGVTCAAVRRMRPHVYTTMCAGFVLLCQASAAVGIEAPVLARVEGVVPATPLAHSVFATLQDGRGRDYLLVLATPTLLASVDTAHVVLDPAAGASSEYIVAFPPRRGDRTITFPVLYDDGRQVVLRANAQQAEILAEQGWHRMRLSTQPVVFPSRATMRGMAQRIAGFPAEYEFDIAQMIEAVHQSNMYTQVARLSGVEAVVVGGQSVIITSRHTSAGAPFMADTQYAFEQLQSWGYAVEYETWTNGVYTNRNVIATMSGASFSSEFVYVVAHIDNMPKTGFAPGADDNASGSAAVLALAEIMQGHVFARTIRFALFTGEEQGFLGSDLCAQQAYTNGLAIVAVHNMDMIAWDSNSNGVLRLHTRTTNTTGYIADVEIAALFTNVVALYGLGNALVPVITADGESRSDHSRFWNWGHAAILAIEDDHDDFNPYYHTTNDTLAADNMPYFTAFTKASLGTIAHLGVVVPEPSLFAAGCAALLLIRTRRHI